MFIIWFHMSQFLESSGINQISQILDKMSWDIIRIFLDSIQNPKTLGISTLIQKLIPESWIIDPNWVDRFMWIFQHFGIFTTFHHWKTDEAPMDRATGGDSDAKALVLVEAPLSDTNLGGLGCHESRRQRRKNMRKYTGTNHQALPNYIIYITSTNKSHYEKYIIEW